MSPEEIRGRKPCKFLLYELMTLGLLGYLRHNRDVLHASSLFSSKADNIVVPGRLIKWMPTISVSQIRTLQWSVLISQPMAADPARPVISPCIRISVD